MKVITAKIRYTAKSMGESRDGQMPPESVLFRVWSIRGAYSDDVNRAFRRI